MKEKTKPWSMDLSLPDVICVKRSVTKCNEQNPSIWTTQCDKGINYIYTSYFFLSKLHKSRKDEREKIQHKFQKTTST